MKYNFSGLVFDYNFIPEEKFKSKLKFDLIKPYL